jgi:hypothetical protein
MPYEMRKPGIGGNDHSYGIPIILPENYNESKIGH